jgi:hypothetical protein
MSQPDGDDTEAVRPWTFVNIEAQLIPCVHCSAPLIIVNGTFHHPLGGRIQLWKRPTRASGEEICITPHRESCLAS